jgi:hypothetical protein
VCAPPGFQKRRNLSREQHQGRLRGNQSGSRVTATATLIVDRTSHARAHAQSGIPQIRQRGYEQARFRRLLERRPLRHDVQSIVRFALIGNHASIESYSLLEHRHLEDAPELFAIFFS